MASCGSLLVSKPGLLLASAEGRLAGARWAASSLGLFQRIRPRLRYREPSACPLILCPSLNCRESAVWVAIKAVFTEIRRAGLRIWF